MKLGLWFDPNAAAVSSRAYLENRANVLSSAADAEVAGVGDRGELPDVPRLAVGRGVPDASWSGWRRRRASRTSSGTRWGSTAATRRGTATAREANTPEERRDAYAFRIPLRLAELARRLGEEVPGAVVDLDVTEGGRAWDSPS